MCTTFGRSVSYSVPRRLQVRGWRTSSAPWLCWPASKRAPPSGCLRCTRSALNRRKGPAYGVQMGGRAGLPRLMHPGLSMRRACIRRTNSALNRVTGPAAYGVHMGGGLVSGLMHPGFRMQGACLRCMPSALNRGTGPAYGIQRGEGG